MRPRWTDGAQLRPNPSGSSSLLAALTGVLAISFSAILVRAAHTEASVSAFARCAYALPLLALLARRDAVLNSRARTFALGAGIFLAIDLLLWHLSIPRIGAGISTVFSNVQVLAVVAVSVARGATVRRLTLIGVPIAFVGITLIGKLGSGHALDELGLVLALLTGVSYAGFLLLFDRSIEQSGGLVISPLLFATLASAVLWAAFAVATGADLMPPLHAQLWLITLALSSQVLGWLMLARGFRGLGAVAVSVLLLLQPVLTLVWGRALYGEHLDLLQGVGVVMTLAGVTLARQPRTTEKGATPTERAAPTG